MPAPRHILGLSAYYHDSAAALVVGGLSVDLSEGVERARAVIDDGAAQQVLERLVSSSKAAGTA